MTAMERERDVCRRTDESQLAAHVFTIPPFLLSMRQRCSPAPQCRVSSQFDVGISNVLRIFASITT